MNKFRLLIAFLFLSFSAFSQFPNPGIEGFENTTGPDVPGQTSVWTLGTGVPGNQWAVFDNGFGTGRWGITTAAGTVHQGVNSGYMNRVNVGINNTSLHYLATPLVTIPANGQLRFWSRTFTLGNNGTLYDIKATAANPAVTDQTNAAAYTNNLITYTEDDLTTDMQGNINAFNVYTLKTLNFPAAMAGTQVYLAFVRRNTQQVAGPDGDRFMIDDIQLVPRCLEPTTLATEGLFATGAELTWANPSGATSWEIQVLPAAVAPTGTGVIYSGPLPYLATATTETTPAPLTPTTQYKYYVRAICSGTGTNMVTSDWVGPTNFTTSLTPPACGGVYSDPGGPTANYANNITGSNGLTTIFPTVPGNLVTVTFTSFATQANLDILRVYDGDFATPSALLGTYSGATLPPSITSSAANGSLTFAFVSNASVQGAGWVANVTCGPPPVCPKPTALTTVLQTNPTGPAVTPVSINVGWTDIGPATSWSYYIVPCGGTPPTAATVGTPMVSPTFTPPNLHSFLITGLIANTCYNIYIKGNCTSTSNGESAWSNVLVVSTPPTCGSTFTDPGGATANYPNNSNTTTTICALTAGDLVTVTFTAFALENNIDFLKVYDGPNITFPLLGNLTGGTIPGPFNATSASGCLTFVFTSDGSGQQLGWLANVTCVTPPPCPQPTALAVSAVLSSSATLNWTNIGVGTSWQVLAQACNLPAPNASTTGWIAVPGPATTYTFTTLNPLTCYNFYVRADCSSTSNGLSLWTGPVSATTQVAPPVCGGNFVDTGGATGNYPDNSNSTVLICPTIAGQQVTVTFTSFNTEATFDGLYVYDSNTVTPAALLASTNGPGNVPGGLAGSYWGNLTGGNLPGPFTASGPSGCLTFVFRSDTIINNPGWVANVTCGPPPTCPRPTAVTLSAVTQNSATVSWTEMGTATQWQVLIIPSNDPTPTAATTGWQTANSTTFTYTPLPNAPQFKVYVRAVCSASDISLWSVPVTFTRPPISTSTTLYTTTQLVQDVLLNSTCATVTNITSSTGSNFGSANGIGYFNQNGSSFPFSQGLILMTGDVTRAPGPNTEGLSDGAAGWGGDTQLFNYIQGLGIDPLLNSYNNATKLEFDFVPLISNMSFDFIFASEEYGTFQCDFSDAFAFFLTNNTTGVTTNLAVLPSTTTPISVITIRDQLYNANCGSANPQYFDSFYGAGGLDPLAAPIDFNGQTVALTASSAVIPGQSYHIKLVIADRNDSLFDSAVFLKGGSFNIGTINLGNNLLEANNTALCDSASFTIQSGLNPANYTFAWTFNGNPIPNQTGPNLTVTQEGLYGIIATYVNTTCSATGSVTIEFYDPVASGTPNNLTLCDASGFGQFTLSQNNASSLGALNPTAYTVVYYGTMADATAEVNALPNLYTNTTAFLQTIYVRVEDIVTGCFTIKPFNLVVQDLTPFFNITPAFALCTGTSGTITVTPTNYNNADATYTWTLDGNPFPGSTNQITVTQAGVYAVTINHQGCINTGQTTVTIDTYPVPDAPANVTACNSYNLPPLTVGSYYTQTGGPNGTGTLIPVNTAITSTQTIYVYAQNGTVPCSAENSFVVTIDPLITPTFTQLGPYCINDTPQALPAVSTNPGNPISGSWTPATIDTTVPGTVVYTFTPAAGICATTATMSITVNPLTTPTFGPIAAICQGGTAPSLPGASSNLNNPISGLWTPATIDTNTVGTGTYTFTPNPGQCAAVTTISVTIHPTPVLAPVSAVNVCDNYVLPALAVGNYFTSPNGVGPITNLTLTTSQTVYVYAQSGTTPNCTDQDSFQVNITTSPQFTITGGCDAGEYVLQVIDTNFAANSVSYNWSGPGNITNNGSPIVVVSAPGTYTCTVSALNNTGCNTTQTFNASDTSCQIQQGISPNSDGLNDSFDLTGFNVGKLSIFNRYGKTVYSKYDYVNEWYGQSDSGNELADGTYYFVIERKDGGETKTGWIYINREK